MFNAKYSILDISPSLHEQTAVWPGDTKFRRKSNLRLQDGSSVELSEMTTTLHIGSHADAPSHYQEHAENIDQLDLSAYIGPCQVLDVQVAPGKRIYPKDIKQEILAERILFRTSSFPNPNEFHSRFASLSKELVDFLAEKNCVLVGIDTPSVDPFDDKVLESHHALLSHGMRNLEGLVLEHVREGKYFLSALPLKIEGADAAPLRAVLLDVWEEDANRT